MKKFLMFLMMFMIGASSITISAQSKEYKKQQSEYQKLAEKTAKKKVKELKKEKWEYTGVLPLEMALQKYYLETTDFGGTMRGIEHDVTSKTVSIGEKTLLLNAQSLYAQEYENMLKADLAESTSGNEEYGSEEYLARVAAKVKHEFNGDITRVILLKKPTNDGRSYMVRGYFLINEDAGRLRAKRIAEQVERNNGMIDSIHDKTFGDE